MIVILLPVHNQVTSLAVFLPKIDQAMRKAGLAYQLIVGDDGSDDGTANLLEEAQLRYPIEVLNHRRNRGQVETVRDLLERAADQSNVNDVIVRMDCDHAPQSIVEMLKKINDGADVVTACRSRDGRVDDGTFNCRSFLNSIGKLLMRLAFPIRNVRELSCDFRLYRADLIKEALDVYGDNFFQIKGLGLTCALEETVKLEMLGARFAEVESSSRYDNERNLNKLLSITTLGYLIVAICYHWPRFGWKSQHLGNGAVID